MIKTPAYKASARLVPAALGRALARLAAELAAAERRASERKALRELPDYLLRDMGFERTRF